METCARKSRLFDRESLAAFAIYCGLSLLFFGRGLIGHFGDRYIGVGPDPSAHMFCLAWWPYAMARHINPFINRISWAGATVNMATNTSMALAALVLAPITLLGGPIRSYNLLMLASPALSAWAGFILFRRVCTANFPAFASGYLFGFSPFILAHILGQPVFIAGWFPAFAVYLTVLRLDERISARKFAVLIALVIAGQLGWSLELTATASFAGAIALALAFRIGDAELRSRIIGLTAPLASAYAAATATVSPYFYYLYANGPLRVPDFIVHTWSTPADLFVPAPVNLIGAIGLSRIAAPHSEIYDTTAYIGLPALSIVCLAAFRHGKPLAMNLALAMLAIVVVLSFGPLIKIDGHHLPAPGIVMLFTPILKHAEPARFAAYFFLCIGTIFALWLSDISHHPAARTALGALAILSLAPNPRASFWTTNADTPAFFSAGIYRRYLSPVDTVLILPYGPFGDGNLWQARAALQFRMAGGFMGLAPPVPDSYREWPVVASLYGLTTMPNSFTQMAAFLMNKGVTKIIVPDGGAPRWGYTFGDGPVSFRLRPFNPRETAAIAALFAPFDPAPERIGGVTIYSVHRARLGAYANLSPQRLQIDAASAQMRTLIAAAESYFAQGQDPNELSIDAAARLNLVPHLWLFHPDEKDPHAAWPLDNGLLMRADNAGRVTLGVRAPAAALAALGLEYAAFSTSARITDRWPSLNWGKLDQPVLLLDFNRKGLRAAAQVHISYAPIQ
jgi:hypothetical protein